MCLLYRPTSLPGSSPGCPGGCSISNCQACYYSYNDLPFPHISDTSCPRQCTVSGDRIDKKCMEKWGRCVKRAYSTVYKSVNHK